jgi:uncharacterized protein YhhL (DUF1145 family)
MALYEHWIQLYLNLVYPWASRLNTILFMLVLVLIGFCHLLTISSAQVMELALPRSQG